MTMTMNNLPRDLVEEILSRVPVKSIGVVRSTCKTWNVLSKDERFANKHIDKAAASASREKDFLMISAWGSMDYLISVNLYETCNKNFGLSIKHKILRFSNDNPHIDIYYVSSDSWRILDVAFDRNIIKYTEPGISLKGFTYWYATNYELEDGFLHCFDFTRERFGPRLPLPPCSQSFHTVSISSVKEEKLAVLFAPWYTASTLDILVTNKIEPYEVSWSNFFKVETMQHIDLGFLSGRFFIDEERKVIVVFGMYDNAYYISGESGDFRKMYPR